MKTKSIILACAFIVAELLASAEPSSLFSYDKQALNNKMQGLATIENYVNENEGITLCSLGDEGEKLADVVLLADESSFGKALNDGPAGIPSFLWGCVLSFAGVILVYGLTEDSEEAKKALYGCLTGGAAFLIIYIGFLAIAKSYFWY